MPLIAPFIRDHLIRFAQHPRAIDQIEVNVDALTRCIACRTVHMHGAHIQALQKRMLMMTLGLGDTARDRSEDAIVEIRPDGRRIVLLDAALHQKEDHLGPLQEHLELETRIARTDLGSGVAHVLRGRALKRGDAAHAANRGTVKDRSERGQRRRHRWHRCRRCGRADPIGALRERRMKNR